MPRAAHVRRRSAAWLGIVLIRFAALFPVVTHAGSRLFGAVEWVELCTTFSMERIALDRQGNPVNPDAELAPRCIVCTLSALSLAMPPGAPLMSSSEPNCHERFCFAFVSPDTAEYFHQDTQARAPPLSLG